MTDINQRHLMIYTDKHIRDINDAYNTIKYIPNPILCYRQTITINNLCLDESYKKYIYYNNGILTITFPKEYIAIGNIYNNKNCNMVTYYNDPNHSYIKEINIDRKNILNIMDYPNTKIIVKMKNEKNIVITFDAYICKRIINSSL